MAREPSFAPSLNIWNEPLESKNDRNTSEKDQGNTKDDQSPDIQPQLDFVEVFPWHNGAKVHKVQQVDNQVED
ncbi:hypothetical protein WICPIJ_000480 [Wickerhamomyces pijperi]|uniref:Uncharacterized protein n=1 Tax=Wickerhamomyces pijperi TaxID=599730 RepID=A0A9P8QG65_WICPI|nr:hypothetical protein WICPIJ_000480 [Wickerhamomyces pijperi]